MTHRTFEPGQVWLNRSTWMLVEHIIGRSDRVRLIPVYSPTILMSGGRPRYRNANDVPPSWELHAPDA